jgi:hypothetical protein
MPATRRLSSFGEEQLRWLDGQLSEGRHTVIIVRQREAGGLGGMTRHCRGGGCPAHAVHPACPPAAPQMHHPLVMSVLGEAPESPRWRDLRAVLAAHDNVRLVLSGHCHKASPPHGAGPAAPCQS